MAKKENVEAKAPSQPETVKTLELTVKDRILFADFFPERSSLNDQWISKDIQGKINVSEQERKELNLRIVPGPREGTGRWVWDEKKEKSIRITLSNAEVQFLKDQVERINKTAIPGERGFTMEAAEVAKKIKDL